jgi:hypothetical protein
MKHLLNEMSFEERQSILEQHSGGKSIDTSKFKRLMESKLGDVKPLISEQEVKQGAAGDPYQYKKEGGKYFYAKKAEGTNAKWIERTDDPGIKAIQTKIFKEQPVATNTGQPVATNTGQPVATNTGQPVATNTGQPQTTTEVKEGAPLKNPEKTLTVGTEFVTWTRDQNRKETNKLCKVVQVEDIANEQGEYRMVKATDVNNGTDCGGVKFNNPTTGGKEGWIAFSKLSQYNYYQKGRIGNKTETDSRGDWSWDADSGRQNEYSIFNKA